MSMKTVIIWSAITGLQRNLEDSKARAETITVIDVRDETESEDAFCKAV